MLLPAFWQAKAFTTTRLPLLHSSICFYIQAFSDSIALGTDSSHTCRGQSPYQMDHQAEQSVITFSKLLFSHPPYLISVKMREWFQLLCMERKRLKIGDELLGFFLTFKAEVHSKAPQNNAKHLPFDCALPPANPWNVSGAPQCCAGCWVSEVFGYTGAEMREGWDIHKD